MRPVATSLMMLAIVLAGFLAYRMLPLSSLPEIDYPTIRVLTLYPGASPEVTTSTITSQRVLWAHVWQGFQQWPKKCFFYY